MPPAGQAGRNNPGGGRRHGHPIKAAGTAALCRVFSVVPRKGQAIPRDGSGGRHRQAPGKPEQNAVPRKGDTMGMARAGDWHPTPAAKHHIFSVHTAAFMGTAAFFYSTYFYLFPKQITKRHIVLIKGVPKVLWVRFFCASRCGHFPPFRGRSPPFQS